MRVKPLVIGVILLLLSANITFAQAPLLSIGAIQGAAGESPYLNRFVNFRGVVVGRYEDQNTRGDVYYTLFVQNLADEIDGDPATSDGIAVFLGRESRPDIPLGAQVVAGGKVTEFYGLTEIDDNGLVLMVEESSGPLPEPVVIDPPAAMDEMAIYFEALEGMRVAFDGAAVVAGPTHVGCGFAVTGEAAAAELPAARRADDDPVGRVVPVLYPSDRSCDDIPQVKAGDRVTGVAGALTYNFDQFKIVIDSADQLAIEPGDLPVVPTLPALGPEQISVASINAEDYFDTARDTAEEGEPVPTEEEVAGRRVKLAHTIAKVLNCPALIAFQEVEHAALLADLSAALEEPCGFVYRVSHLDSPDARGIDNALLADPRRVVLGDATLRQTCSPVPTGIIDPSVACPAGEEALFGRPPLQVDTRIDGEPYTIFVNHFKSKRGGEVDTGLERIRQAVYLNGLAADMLAIDPAARIIALGDFNDTELSPALALLADTAQGGVFVNALAAVPPSSRYTYNFGGVVELIDAILLSPTVADEVGLATIIHTNTDFPVGWRLDTSPERLAFRVSDHDIPVVVLGQFPATPTPEPTADEVLPIASPIPSPTPVSPPPTAEAEPTAEPELVADVRPPATEAAITAVARPPQQNRDASMWLAAIGGGLLVLAIVVYIRMRR
jgi:predicted extracellular nuclease